MASAAHAHGGMLWKDGSLDSTFTHSGAGGCMAQVTTGTGGHAYGGALPDPLALGSGCWPAASTDAAVSAAMLFEPHQACSGGGALAGSLSGAAGMPQDGCMDAVCWPGSGLATDDLFFVAAGQPHPSLDASTTAAAAAAAAACAFPVPLAPGEATSGNTELLGDASDEAAPTAANHKQFTASSRKQLTSKYRGVCWNKKNKRWQAAINSSGKYIYLGSFTSEDDAARQFDRAAIKIRGKKAKLNFAAKDYVDAEGNLVEELLLPKPAVGGSKAGSSSGSAGGSAAKQQGTTAPAAAPACGGSRSSIIPPFRFGAFESAPSASQPPPQAWQAASDATSDGAQLYGVPHAPPLQRTSSGTVQPSDIADQAAMILLQRSWRDGTPAAAVAGGPGATTVTTAVLPASSSMQGQQQQQQHGDRSRWQPAPSACDSWSGHGVAGTDALAGQAGLMRSISSMSSSSSVAVATSAACGAPQQLQRTLSGPSGLAGGSRLLAKQTSWPGRQGPGGVADGLLGRTGSMQLSRLQHQAGGSLARLASCDLSQALQLARQAAAEQGISDLASALQQMSSHAGKALQGQLVQASEQVQGVAEQVTPPADEQAPATPSYLAGMVQEAPAQGSRAMSDGGGRCGSEDAPAAKRPRSTGHCSEDDE